MIWLSRNEALHRNKESHGNKEQHQICDNAIDEIIQKTPPSRTLTKDARAFFKRDKGLLKKMRLGAKKKWIAQAEIIISRFEGNLTAQSQMFVNYFAPD